MAAKKKAKAVKKKAAKKTPAKKAAKKVTKKTVKEKAPKSTVIKTKLDDEGTTNAIAVGMALNERWELTGSDKFAKADVVDLVTAAFEATTSTVKAVMAEGGGGSMVLPGLGKIVKLTKKGKLIFKFDEALVASVFGGEEGEDAPAEGSDWD